MTQPMRVAVVTPYYKEAAHVLRRCLDSVRAQTHAQLVHYLVADGFPQTELVGGQPGVRHIVLPNAHANYGCTPRGIGAQCALADDMDVVCFLDADNLYQPEHVASLVDVYQRASAAGMRLDAAFALRYQFVPGHEQLRIVPPGEEPGSAFADTSCISFSRSAAFLWGAWCQIPKSLTPVCDQFMMSLIRYHQLNVTWTAQRTVLYESNWSATYVQAGLPVPTSGLHDDTLRQVGQGLTDEALWAMLRVRRASAPVPSPSEASP